MNLRQSMSMIPLVMKIIPSQLTMCEIGAQIVVLSAKITANKGMDSEAVSSLRANISKSSYSNRSAPCFCPKRSRASLTDETSRVFVA